MDEAVYLKGHFVHLSCMNAEIKKSANKKKIEQAERVIKKRKVVKPITVNETKDPESKKELKERKEFEKTIEDITGRKPIVQEKAYARKLIKDYKLTYKEIGQALYYFYKILDRSQQEGSNLLGIVPYVIDKSRQYYQELDEAIEINSKMNTRDFYKETKIVISKPETNKRGDNIKEIDLEALLDRLGI